MSFAPHLTTEAASIGEQAPAISDRLGSVGRRIGAWVNACADYWAAASLYEQLRHLSDAELNRRGLSRATLARDVCGACDRAGGPLGG
jgi:hypothetical protein